MTSPLALLDESQRLYATAVEQVAGRLDARTPCSDYSALDLINHHILTLHSFAAPIDGGPTASFDEIIGAADVTGGDPVGTTKSALQRVHVAYNGADLTETKTYNLGPVPVGNALAALIMQDVIHAWDLAQAAGTTITPSEELLGLCEAVAAELVPRRAVLRHPAGRRRGGPSRHTARTVRPQRLSRRPARRAASRRTGHGRSISVDVMSQDIGDVSASGHR